MTYIGIIISLLIILCANEFLNFGWWWHIHGVFNIADVGNFLAWLGLAVMFLKGDLRTLWKAPISYMVLAYLLFVVVQISLAAFYHEQPLTTGFVGSRHQFYYASFFFFFLYFDNTEKIRGILNATTVVAMIALALGLINYLGPNILTHKWAHGHGIRSGIVRPFIPGMSILSLAIIWEFSKFISATKFRLSPGILTLVLLAGHFFRQTRMRIIGILVVFLVVLLIKRKFKLLLSSLFLLVSSVITVGLIMEENIIIDPLISAYVDVSSSSGASWRARIEQARLVFEEFKEHPILGSGSISLRLSRSSIVTSKKAQLASLGYMSDFGYLHWLKAYGLLGMIWLIAFFSLLWSSIKKISRRGAKADEDITFFAGSSVAFLVITFFTLNHLMFPNSIVLVCLLAAIIARLNFIDGASHGTLDFQSERDEI